MTNYQLILYRITELMYEKQQHILEVDLLFDDEFISEFVKSIQIDSPYQQLVQDGVLTEFFRDGTLFICFTVEGYFHYLLSQIIENKTRLNSPEILQDIIEKNKLKGIFEAVELCLINDVEKNNFSRLIWLIDQDGKSQKVCFKPLAQAFLIIDKKVTTEEEKNLYIELKSRKILTDLFSNPSDNDILTLSSCIKLLEKMQQFSVVKIINKILVEIIKPQNVNYAIIILEAFVYIDIDTRKRLLAQFEELSFAKEDIRTSEYYLMKGYNYGEIKDYETAILLYDKCLRIRLDLLGENHNDTAIILTNIGVIYNKKSDFNSAQEYFIRSLNVRLNLVGDNHTDTAICYNNLAYNFRKKQEFKKALEYFDKCLKIRLSHYGEYHIETASCLRNLGHTYLESENLESAIEHMKRALKIIININGENNLSVASINSILGSTYSKLNDYPNAENCLIKSINIYTNILGEKSIEAALCINNLGMVYSKRGEHENALDNYKKALNIRISVLGENHKSVAIGFNNIGSIYHKLNDIEKALENYESSYVIYKSIFGESHEKSKKILEKIKKINSGEV